jgi:hypothetical protein
LVEYSVCLIIILHGWITTRGYVREQVM